jgi:hypothetical protein
LRFVPELEAIVVERIWCSKARFAVQSETRRNDKESFKKSGNRENLEKNEFERSKIEKVKRNRKIPIYRV